MTTDGANVNTPAPQDKQSRSRRKKRRNSTNGSNSPTSTSPEVNNDDNTPSEALITKTSGPSPILRLLILAITSILSIPIFYGLYYAQNNVWTLSPPPSNYGTGSMFDTIAPRYDFVNRM
eukprot:CAMPEP_0171319616 /NCGR_PEP_ID=MMETSP0816-20121228/97973_1 /TAXON_ID=420281 /ORGANISM="Proboscia inermis, Strain CCAP1064/1" /LENGTH=119 /DNA_ID=CAMNT_0011815507 /DNA_START=121 /DNA_END=477 /DNA_ORIENTATION=+